ncbi:hypothetical protein KY290_000279 [Solanum tuberosum]|uniref:Uncharacterized protein n=1 Tax=Solanum tuberosum TaxID=4113 RepID=A0ABQ7WIV2_SOLTU|nr:hypothetical protein KY290_000279 [Solanum tuberosum]
MPYRDVYSWTSMIHGYMKNGCSEGGKYMVRNEGLSVFMTTTLIAFYVKVGCLVYALKGEANGLQPNELPLWQFYQLVRMEHYGFMKKMPLEADATFLGDLMGACRLHGAIELGNEVA